MNYNITAYLIYTGLTLVIILYVGRLFYTNGRIFIHALFPDDSATADHLNKMLLIAYYLFNIGYAFLKFRQWEKLTDLASLISSISSNMGILILTLSVSHYLNMLTIYYLSGTKKIFTNNKAFQP